MSKPLLFQIVKQILVNLVVHLFYERRYLVNGTSSPRDTHLPFDMLFITMFYTCHVTEVVYHSGEQLRIRKSLKLYIVLYRNTMKNMKISLNKIWYTYTALIPTNMMFSLLNKWKFWIKCVSWTNDQNIGEGCTVYRYMSFPCDCFFTIEHCSILATFFVRLFPISQSDSRLFQFNGGKPTFIFSEHMVTIFTYHIHTSLYYNTCVKCERYIDNSYMTWFFSKISYGAPLLKKLLQTGGIQQQTECIVMI